MDFAAIGELMSMNISYAKRFPDSYYRPDTKWAYVIMLDPSQRTPNYDQLMNAPISGNLDTLTL
jgi:hypothetical protein